jgi:hypothetical protein
MRRAALSLTLAFAAGGCTVSLGAAAGPSPYGVRPSPCQAMFESFDDDRSAGWDREEFKNWGFFLGESFYYPPVPNGCVGTGTAAPGRRTQEASGTISQPCPPMLTRDEVFDRLDTNHDGRLQVAEACDFIAHSPRPAMTEVARPCKKAFAAKDPNHDWLLEPKDLEAAEFQAMDRNGDRYVTPLEYCTPPGQPLPKVDIPTIGLGRPSFPLCFQFKGDLDAVAFESYEAFYNMRRDVGFMRPLSDEEQAEFKVPFYVEARGYDANQDGKLTFRELNCSSPSPS